MLRMFYVMAGLCVFMVLLAGAGTLLISNTIVAQSKVDAVSSAAKGIALALSEQINLLNSMLDKMAQDPEVVDAVRQNNPALLENAAKKLESHFPGIISVKFLLLSDLQVNQGSTSAMGFADSDMARKTFEANQPTTIQGEANAERHLAIARRIMHDNMAVGVVLAGVKYDFINRILTATPLEKGYIELKQGKLLLASSGKKMKEDDIDNPPVGVPNTGWDLYYENTDENSVIEISLLIGIILIPALVVALAFATGFRKVSALIADDVAWVIKSLKEIVTEKPLGDYPVKLDDLKLIITTLAQFKKVVNDKWFEI